MVVSLSALIRPSIHGPTPFNLTPYLPVGELRCGSDNGEGIPNSTSRKKES